MPDNKTNIIFRIERELKDEFEKIAQATERTISQYLRAFIKDQVRKHRESTAESIKQPKAAPHTTQTEKIEPRPKKGQKLAAAGKAKLRP